MIIRVQYGQGQDKFIGEFEADVTPSLGDYFEYDGHGPYEVTKRTFVYKKSADTGGAADVILDVKGGADTKRITW